MKEIELCPLIDACSLPQEVETEFEEYDRYTHDTDHVIYIDWNDEETFPKFQTWLIETYGDEIVQYERFAVSGC